MVRDYIYSWKDRYFLIIYLCRLYTSNLKLYNLLCSLKDDKFSNYIYKKKIIILCAVYL